MFRSPRYLHQRATKVTGSRELYTGHPKGNFEIVSNVEKDWLKGQSVVGNRLTFEQKLHQRLSLLQLNLYTPFIHQAAHRLYAKL